MAAAIGRVEEHDLQATVLEHLRVYGNKRKAFWFSVPNAGKRSRWVRNRMKREGLKAGIADLCIMLDYGSVAWLELKTEKGKQSSDQKFFEAICKSLGHPYCLARTIDQAIAFLKEIGALR